MNAIAVAAVSRALAVAYSATPNFIRNIKPRPTFTYNSLAVNINVYYMRYDKHSAGTIVKVFDKAGTLLYTIERESVFSPQWVVYAGSDRTQVAFITLGVTSSSVFYLQNSSIKRQVLTGLIDKSLNMNDGTAYSWQRDSRQLSRVVNRGDNEGEVHQRVAVLNLLRKLRFDWEVIVDNTFDHQVAVFTAFIAARTMWPLDTSAGPPAGAE